MISHYLFFCKLCYNFAMKKKIIVILLISLIGITGFGIYQINQNKIASQKVKTSDMQIIDRKYFKVFKTQELFMPALYQNDSLAIMQNCEKAVAVDGCALTAITMVGNYFTFNNYDLETANDVIGDYACVVDKGIFWYYAGLALDITLETVVYADYNDSFYLKDVFVNYLDDSKPVIVGLYNANEKVKTHFVVVYGYAGQTNFTYLIHDPNKLNDFQTLQDYFEAGWRTYEYLVFTK